MACLNRRSRSGTAKIMSESGVHLLAINCRYLLGLRLEIFAKIVFIAHDRKFNIISIIRQ
jgi:hypothetical protein